MLSTLMTFFNKSHPSLTTSYKRTSSGNTLHSSKKDAYAWELVLCSWNLFSLNGAEIDPE